MSTPHVTTQVAPQVDTEECERFSEYAEKQDRRAEVRRFWEWMFGASEPHKALQDEPRGIGDHVTIDPTVTQTRWAETDYNEPTVTAPPWRSG